MNEKTGLPISASILHELVFRTAFQIDFYKIPELIYLLILLWHRRLALISLSW
ncbi:unnamed protein product [Meloidogyne enterolobii]|uniref:Uncharacterized protein n=1 Tax=Meloidogyne enterolobii TaxID=390850 RepID=A0ACB0YKW9_MELEN